MKIAGVIAEYNPFHSGHAWHLARARALTGADYVIVCMAGSYTQRGEATCLSKWTRAKMALMCGADAVFELPALFAVRTADAFARGGVAILDGLGADALSFGCETDDLELVERLAQLRACEPEEVGQAVRRGLNEGKSHARARGEAVAEHLGVDAALVNSPNLTLAAEYLRALRDRRSGMTPVAIRRDGSYHDVGLGDGFASATAIRAALRRGELEKALRYVPEPIRPLLRASGRMHAPDDLALMRLRSMTEAELRALPDMSEGLESRVKRCAAKAACCEELIESIKCKRYTRARLTRLLAHAMLGLTGEMARRNPEPVYARLIGMRADARALSAELKARARIEIVSDATKLAGDEVFDLECRATDLRALQCDDALERCSGREFTEKFVRV